MRHRKIDRNKLFLRFLKKATEKFGNKYDYSKVDYYNRETKICIIHPKYGEFWQTPEKHLTSKDGYPYPNKANEIYTFEYCYEVALSYENVFVFKQREPKIFYKARGKEWLKDYTWLSGVEYYLDRNVDNTHKGQFVYAYEFSDKSVYVGLTNDINRRDKQHRKWEYNKNGTRKYDGVLFHSESNNIPVPSIKILKENLTRKESQTEEQRFINEYKKNGWKILNRVKGGSLGMAWWTVVWDKDAIIEEAKKYRTTTEMRERSRTAYNHMKTNGLEDICFPNKKKQLFKIPQNYSEEFLNSLKEKYPTKKELRKNDVNSYMWLYKNNRLSEFYPE